MFESNRPEVILSVVGEGDGYTVEGLQTTDGWQFRLESGGLDPDSDSWSSRHGEWTPSLDDVISEMSPFWVSVLPTAVHPGFATAIWKQFVAVARHHLLDFSPIERWTELLLGRPFKSLEDGIAYYERGRGAPRRERVRRTTGKEPQPLPQHWQAFAERLGSAIGAMKEDEFLIISLKETNRFVQFAAQGAGGMRVEATSNHFLSGRERLDARQVRALVRLGWRKPTGSPEQSTPDRDPHGSSNFFRDESLPVNHALLAELAIRTLVEIFGVPHEGFLQYEAFDYAGNSYALPGLEIKRQVRDPEIRMAEIAERLLNAVREATELPDLDFDEDGYLQLRSKGLPLFIRLVGGPPMAQFFSPLISGQRASRHLFEQLNHLNLNSGPSRYLLHEDTVLAVLEIPAWPLQIEHVTASLDRFTEASRAVADWLQEGRGPSGLGSAGKWVH